MYLVTVSYFEMKIKYTIISLLRSCVQKNSSNLILTICGVHQVVHCIEIYQLNVIYIVLPLLQICSSMKKIWIDKPRATVPSIQKNLQFTTNKKYASSGLNNLISLNVIFNTILKNFWDILLLRYSQFTCIWYSFINTITGPVKWRSLVCLHVKMMTHDLHVNKTYMYYIFQGRLVCEKRKLPQRQVKQHLL